MCDPYPCLRSKVSKINLVLCMHASTHVHISDTQTCTFLSRWNINLCALILVYFPVRFHRQYRKIIANEPQAQQKICEIQCYEMKYALMNAQRALGHLQIFITILWAIVLVRIVFLRLSHLVKHIPRFHSSPPPSPPSSHYPISPSPLQEVYI